jgi:hypothetical protein
MSTNTQRIDLYANELERRLDQLYKEGKEKKWPKEVMDYLLWWEHETCRVQYGLRYLAKSMREA